MLGGGLAMGMAALDAQPSGRDDVREAPDGFHAIRTGRGASPDAALEPSLTVRVCPTNVGRAVTQTVTRILTYCRVSEAEADTSTV